MRYFEELKTPRGETKVAVDGLVGNFSSRPTSHKGAWPALLVNQLQHAGYMAEVLYDSEAWDDYDVVVIDWGMEFRGTFNLFGGATDALADRLSQFLAYQGKLVSAHRECPDLGELVRSRRKSSKSKAFNDLDDQALTEKCKQVDWFDHVFEADKLVFGDSHSVSAYRPGYMISRHDGLTLHGALKRGLLSYVTPFERFGHVKDLVIYLGNIDLRFHVFRQSDPMEATHSLLEEYVNQLSELAPNMEITVVGLLPVEYEGRKLPGTGLYDGQPFYGSRQQRADMCNTINLYLDSRCRANGWTFETWPKEWYLMDPEDFAKIHLEAKQSVHLRRDKYMHQF